MLTKFTTPFKWAGSKIKELPKLQSIIADSNLRICEPFMGTGTLIANLGQEKGCFGNDLNFDIINLLRNFKNPEFMRRVNLLMTKENMGSKDFFYARRSEFNETEHEGIERASLFFFLQNCAHFGLYRLNPKGQYTSTWHFFSKVPILERRIESLHLLDQRLKVLESLPYKEFLKKYENEIENSCDLLFIDPPYLNASHKDYSVGNVEFNIEEYQYLDDLAGYLAKKGVKSIICNYSTPDDDIIYSNKESIVRFTSSRSMRLDNFIKRESIYVLYGFGNSLL